MMGWQQEVLRDEDSWFIEDGWTLDLSTSRKDKDSGLYHYGVSHERLICTVAILVVTMINRSLEPLPHYGILYELP